MTHARRTSYGGVTTEQGKCNGLFDNRFDAIRLGICYLGSRRFRSWTNKRYLSLMERTGTIKKSNSQFAVS